jgi:ACDE family multidrug resistance protein
MESKTPSREKEQKNWLYLDPNLLIIFGVTLVAVMGVASLAPAFPLIGDALGIPRETIGLLIIVFTLPGAIFTPILGVLADRYGRKTILIPSLFLFGIAGGACAFARDFLLLLILRFFQGFGAASLGSLNVTIIGDLYTNENRANAMGYNASITSIGTASYPAIGGIIAGLFGWYFPFFLPLLAIPIGIIVLLGLKNPEPREEAKFGEYLHNAWKAINNRQVAGVFISSLFTFIILYGAIVNYISYLPIIGGDALLGGLLISCLSIAAALTATQTGMLVRRYGERTLLLVAFPLYALALVLIPLLPILWSVFLPFIPIIWALVIPVGIYGMAQAINIPSLQMLLARLALPEYRAALMSINGMVLRWGQTLGPLIMAIAIILWDIQGVFFTACSFALIMIPIVIVTINAKEKGTI